MQIETMRVRSGHAPPMTNLEAVRAAVRPSTRLAVIETPSAPLLRITELAEEHSDLNSAHALQPPP